jgi:KipI family sensor histidine kinase inhibitor
MAHGDIFDYLRVLQTPELIQIMKLSRYGEDGIRLLFGNSINLEIHEEVRRIYFFLKSLDLKEIIDIIPSFRSCLVHFNSEMTSFQKLASFIMETEPTATTVDLPEPKTYEVPVRYGGEFGPDMEFLTFYLKLTEDEIVKIYTSVTYTVFTVGFIPGFPYLGILDRRLSVPRLETPRVKVPEGSVGIAQLQTGIYSFDSPAGWRIIGRTDQKLFNPKEEPYSLLQIGDKIRFLKI